MARLQNGRRARVPQRERSGRGPRRSASRGEVRQRVHPSPQAGAAQLLRPDLLQMSGGLRPLVAELIGTAMLLAAVVGSGIMGARLASGNVAVALLANSLA